MRSLKVLLSAVVVFSLGALVDAQTGKQPEKRPASIALWESQKTTEKEVLAAREQAQKAITAFKEIRKKAQKASYDDLRGEIFEEAKKQRGAMTKAQHTLVEAEKKHLFVMIGIMQKMTDLVEKDIAAGEFNGVPQQLMEAMKKIAKDGKNLPPVPERAINDVFMLASFQVIAIDSSFSTREAACGLRLLIGKTLGRADDEKGKKEIADARKSYEDYLNEVVSVYEQMAVSPTSIKSLVPKASSK